VGGGGNRQCIIVAWPGALRRAVAGGFGTGPRRGASLRRRCFVVDRIRKKPGGGSANGAVEKLHTFFETSRRCS